MVLFLSATIASLHTVYCTPFKMLSDQPDTFVGFVPERNQSNHCVPANMIPCEWLSLKHLKIHNSNIPVIVRESLHEEFHKSQKGADLWDINRHYHLFKKLYLEQRCWHLKNVGPHSQHFDPTVTWRLNCAKDHTVEAFRPPSELSSHDIFKSTHTDLSSFNVSFIQILQVQRKLSNSICFSTS